MVPIRIEVDYSGCGTTRSVLKWIAVDVALHVALCVLVFLFFYKDEAVVKLSFNFFFIAEGCWLDDRGNEGSFKCTTTDYEGGGANTLAL